MVRKLILAFSLAASACAPGPVSMEATQASEVLAQFAVGRGPADVCTPDGQALLRGAVRAYGREMNSAGVTWPAVPVRGGPNPDELDAVEISVLIAFSAGFVNHSDFSGPARGAMTQLALAHMPELRGMRTAARVACAEVVDLQQAASRFVMESQRLDRITEDARSQRAGERAHRQSARVERALEAMQIAAAAVEARVVAARES